MMVFGISHAIASWTVTCNTRDLSAKQVCTSKRSLSQRLWFSLRSHPPRLETNKTGIRQRMVNEVSPSVPSHIYRTAQGRKPTSV